MWPLHYLQRLESTTVRMNGRLSGKGNPFDKGDNHERDNQGQADRDKHDKYPDRSGRLDYEADDRGRSSFLTNTNSAMRYSSDMIPRSQKPSSQANTSAGTTNRTEQGSRKVK